MIIENWTLRGASIVLRCPFRDEEGEACEAVLQLDEPSIKDTGLVISKHRCHVCEITLTDFVLDQWGVKWSTPGLDIPDLESNDWPEDKCTFG